MVDEPEVRSIASIEAGTRRTQRAMRALEQDARAEIREIANNVSSHVDYMTPRREEHAVRHTSMYETDSTEDARAWRQEGYAQGALEQQAADEAAWEETQARQQEQRMDVAHEERGAREPTPGKDFHEWTAAQQDARMQAGAEKFYDQIEDKAHGVTAHHGQWLANNRPAWERSADTETSR